MDKKYKGSEFKEVGNITLGTIAPEARDLLDEIMKEWENHLANVKKDNADYNPTFYGFAYWLVRWSNLIEPAKKAE